MTSSNVLSKDAKNTLLRARGIKLVAWINIAFQVAFPLAGAFTPAMASAGGGKQLISSTDECAGYKESSSNRRFLPDSTEQTIKTRVYTLSAGESFSSILKKFNISPKALRKLNLLRTFARGIEKIQPGDELDVPLARLPDVVWHECNSGTGPRSDNPHDTSQAMKFANVLSQTGHFLSRNPDIDSAADMARGRVTGEASNQAQQWLRQFGHARVQLNADKNFSLKRSEFDLLVPVYEQGGGLVFTQGSLHRTDDRTQSNLGVGYRWFDDAWMVGGNTFLDYDLSRNHSRLGVGVEYWRDSLKMSVNAYKRLSNWKNSPDVVDYEERPANGWDFRSQAWLPFLPQLGARFTFEQYYGGDVALFGKDNRQRNPHAITAGINYTPVPLLKLSAEQRQGKSGKSDARFGVELSYQLGMPWRQQINPDAVAAMRSLAGSRYDFIDRNNNIVLEFRKKQVIHLFMTDLITGYAGEEKPLGVSVNSKYGMDRIDWSAPSLVAAGGKIVQTGANYTVVLPDWRSEADGVNTYTIRAVAYDNKGNKSNQRETQVTVTQAAIALNASVFSPSSLTLPADGKTQHELVLSVNDREGHPVDIAANEISVVKTVKQYGTNDATRSATLSDFIRKDAGVYAVSLKAGTLPESLTLTPSARNTTFASATVFMTADNSTALIDTLEVVTNNVIADGKTKGKVKVVVVDAQNNRVPGQIVSLKADNNATVGDTIVTDKQGEAVAFVTNVRSGEAIITASVNGYPGKDGRITFLPDPKTAQIIQQNLTILPEISLADGQTPKTISARVTDAHDNIVPNMSVTFSADNGASVLAATVKSDDQGLVGTTLISTKAGKSRVSATVNNLSTYRETAFSGNKATALVDAVQATDAEGVADGKTAATFTALIKDQYGNPLQGVPVDWQSNKDGSYVMFDKSQTLTNSNGLATTSVTSTKAYTNVIVTALTNASSKGATPFIFIADKKHGVIEQLTSDRKVLTANGVDAAQLKISVTDTHGNPLKGMNVTLGGDKRAVIKQTQLKTNDDGLAYTSLTTTQAGEVTVVVTLDNGSQKSLMLNAEADTRSAVVTVKASSDIATAGQKAPVVLTATVADAYGNPVQGTSVAWKTDHNLLNGEVSLTNQRGEAIIELSGTKAVLTTVTAVLYNGKKGESRVTFGHAEISGSNSEFGVYPQSITADGTSAATGTLTLRDRFNNPVLGRKIAWSHPLLRGGGALSEKGNGVYEIRVTGTQEGKHQITVADGSYGHFAFTRDLVLLANKSTGKIRSVGVEGRAIAKANGLESVKLRVQIEDANGNTKVKGVAVGWGTTLGSIASPLSYTNENGIAEITLSSRQAGDAFVTAMLGGSAPVKADKTINFTAGSIDEATSSISISTSSIVAGKENANVTVTARDAEGNLLTGLKDSITLHFAPDLRMANSAFSEVSSGLYMSSVTGEKFGTAEITAQVANTRVNHKARLSIRADNASATLSGAILVSNMREIVSQKVSYTAVVTDKFGNGLGAGIPVTWSANEGSILDEQVTQTDSTGKVSVKLTRHMAGVAAVSIILPSGRTNAPEVTFAAGTADEGRSELALSPSSIIAGKESSTLTLVLRDIHGNPLSGQSVSAEKISGTADIIVSKSQEVPGKAGVYTMSVTGKQSGEATLKVKVNNVLFTQTRTLTVKGDTGSWRMTSVVPDKTRLIAGDTKGVTFSTTVTDTHGNKLPDVFVTWQLQGQSVSYSPTSRTNSQGVATTTVVSQTAGSLVMTAWLDESKSLKANTVVVSPAEVDVTTSTFKADKTTIGSDGKDAVTFTVHLVDRFGNAVPGQNVVITQGASTRSGFTLSSVTDDKNGRYTVMGTSTAKGDVSLIAKVGNKVIGKEIKISVGAITPDMRFDNANQIAVYTNNFTKSQIVKGAPTGIQQIWSSSDKSVATVDATSGTVTLLKSGETRIAVYTPGSPQFNHAMASYSLIVEKADPILKVDRDMITAKWADGQKHRIQALFKNADVGSGLTPAFSSNNTGVVTVSQTGELTAAKPGNATLSVRSRETDQFKESLVNVTYVLNKGSIDIRFANANVAVTDEGNFTLQDPKDGIPKEASTNWESSNAKVINLRALNNRGSGQARLTLNVRDNDYFTASSGYYDVEVYTKPSVNLGEISFVNKGEKKLLGASHWTPTFEGDDMVVTWSVDTANAFSQARSVEIALKDESNAVLFRKKIPTPKEPQTTVIPADVKFWGKKARVELVADGYGNLQSIKKSADFEINNLRPEDIWRSLKTTSATETHISSGKDDSCKAYGPFGREHWNYVFIKSAKVDFGGKNLISGMRISARVSAHQKKNSGQRFDRSGNFSEVHSDIRSDKDLNFSRVQSASDCLRNDTGSYQIIMNVDYAGKTYTYFGQDWGWGGNGDGLDTNRDDIFD